MLKGVFRPEIEWIRDLCAQVVAGLLRPEVYISTWSSSQCTIPQEGCFYDVLQQPRQHPPMSFFGF